MKITQKKGTPTPWHKKPSKWEPLIQAVSDCPTGEHVECVFDTESQAYAARAMVFVRLRKARKGQRLRSRAMTKTRIVFWWTTE